MERTILRTCSWNLALPGGSGATSAGAISGNIVIPPWQTMSGAKACGHQWLIQGFTRRGFIISALTFFSHRYSPTH